MDISDVVLNKIKEKDIKPRSEIFLSILNSFGYIALAITTATIIALLGLFVFNTFEAGDLIDLIAIPLLFIVVLAAIIFVILIKKLFKSDNFYKYPRFKFAGLVLVLIISGTLIWNGIGAAKAADLALQDNKEYCKTVKKAIYVRWSTPEKGYLAGEVEEKPISPRTFTLKDLRRNIWEIHPIENLDTTFVDDGEFVKLRGEIINPRAFRADEITLWQGKMWFDILD